MCQTVLEAPWQLTEITNGLKISISNHGSLSYIGDFVHYGDSVANFEVTLNICMYLSQIFQGF